MTKECYARELGGCQGVVSREHGISKNLLLKLGEMEVEAPWIRGGRRKMTERTMFSRVLCEAHNAALSNFDTEVGKLFDLLAASTRKELRTWETINGDYLERWALKVLFADVASSKVPRSDGREPEPCRDDTKRS